MKFLGLKMKKFLFAGYTLPLTINLHSECIFNDFLSSTYVSKVHSRYMNSP